MIIKEDMLINPTKLTDTGAEILRTFLQQNPDFSGVFFTRDQCQRYKCVYKDKKISFGITHAMISRVKTKNDGQDRYHEFDVIGNLIGMGNFGVVNDIVGSLSLSRYPVREFAFKKKSDHSMIKTQHHYIDYPCNLSLQEFSLLKKTNHIKTKYYQYVESASKSFIIASKVKGKSLREIITEDQYGPRCLTVEHRLRLSINILRAIKNQVHDKGIIHRDIKPENIIVDDELNVTIIDYGLSRMSDVVDGMICGSVRYLEPALLTKNSLSRQQDQASDTYASAVVLRDLWSNYLIRSQYNDVCMRTDNVISAMLVELPDRRLSIPIAIQHIDKIRIDHVSAQVSPEFRDGIHAAHGIALDINAMFMADNKEEISYLSTIQILLTGVEKFSADHFAVSEFLLTLGMNENKSMMRRFDLLDLLVGIQDSVCELDCGLRILIDSISRQKIMDVYLSDSMSEMRKINYDYILMLANHELRKLERGPGNLHDIQSLHERVRCKLMYLQRLRLSTMFLGAWSEKKDQSDLQEKISLLLESKLIKGDARRLHALTLCKLFIEDRLDKCWMKMYSLKVAPNYVVRYLGRVVTALASCIDNFELHNRLLAEKPSPFLNYSQLRVLHKDIISVMMPDQFEPSIKT